MPRLSLKFSASIKSDLELDPLPHCLNTGQIQRGRLQGDVKVNFKPVALVKFYNTTKSQIQSTKSQINPKSQHSMTKTFAKIEAHHDVKSGEPGMMPLGATINGHFVLIFELGSLGFF